MGDLAHVDLGGEMAADRLLERLTGLEIAAGEGPGAEVRLPGALPQEHLERALAHLEDHGQRDVRRRGPGDVFASGSETLVD